MMGNTAGNRNHLALLLPHDKMAFLFSFQVILWFRKWNVLEFHERITIKSWQQFHCKGACYSCAQNQYGKGVLAVPVHYLHVYDLELSICCPVMHSNVSGAFSSFQLRLTVCHVRVLRTEPTMEHLCHHSIPLCWRTSATLPFLCPSFSVVANFMMLVQCAAG